MKLDGKILFHPLHNQGGRIESSDSTSKLLILHTGHGGRRFIEKVFGDSCLPQCEDGEKEFSMLVASDAECLTDISDRQAIKNTFKAFKKNFCDAEVRNYLLSH
jgi:hypothetical protein